MPYLLLDFALVQSIFVNGWEVLSPQGRRMGFYLTSVFVIIITRTDSCQRDFLHSPLGWSQGCHCKFIVMAALTSSFLLDVNP